MHNLKLKKFKIIKMDASISVQDTESKINNLLSEGYRIIDISTMAPRALPGGETYSRDNYYVYHLGLVEEELPKTF